jgi:hypothetical protein
MTATELEQHLLAGETWFEQAERNSADAEKLVKAAIAAGPGTVGDAFAERVQGCAYSIDGAIVMHRDCAGFGTEAARDLSVDQVREVFSRCGVRPRGFVNETASGQDFVMAHFLQSRSKMELLLDKADEHAVIARQNVAGPRRKY